MDDDEFEFFSDQPAAAAGDLEDTRALTVRKEQCEQRHHKQQSDQHGEWSTRQSPISRPRA
jgi:hypothetical protein